MEPFTTPLVATVPTLAQMADGALNVLAQDPDGFTLMIEGGAIDWAGHSNLTGRMIDEEQGFSEAVEAAAERVDAHSNWEDAADRDRRP